MSKYAALRDYLNGLKSDHWNATFNEIENLLGFTLPSSARRYPAWWANQNPRSHAQCSGWLDAGWKASELNLTRESVTFIKFGEGIKNSTEYKPTRSELDWPDIISPDCEKENGFLNIEFSWQSLGNVSIDQKERLRFPKVPGHAAIYRFALKNGKQSEIYIGETEDFARRLQHYRTPGVTQRTNQRVNDLMKQCLADGGKVGVFVALDHSISSGGKTPKINLKRKSQRRLFENVALVLAENSGANLINQ